MITLERILELTRYVCRQMAYQYKQDPDELYSYCSIRIPSVINRINPQVPEKTQEAYVKTSVRGYCQHWLRDKATLIRTPRGEQPFKTPTLTNSYEFISNETQDKQQLPVWVEDVLDSNTLPPELKRQFANAYLFYLHG